jgi:hypothetical protein
MEGFFSPSLEGRGSGGGSNATTTNDGSPTYPLAPSLKGGGNKRKPKVPAAPSRPKRGLWFAPPAPPPMTAAEKKAAKAKARAERPPRMKNDPKLVAAARELRDRYIEQINAGLLLPPSANGKYDVSRQLEAAPSAMKQTPLLKAA